MDVLYINYIATNDGKYNGCYSKLIRSPWDGIGLYERHPGAWSTEKEFFCALYINIVSL